MVKTQIKEKKRFYKHKRVRSKVIGTMDRPRVCVHRSLKNLYVQVIDDANGVVLMGMSTLTKFLREKLPTRGNRAAASALGEAFAIELNKKGIKKICFDRGGWLYHGRIKAFAEAVRKGGMEF